MFVETSAIWSQCFGSYYSYLELYLQQRRKVDQRHFHALLHPSNLHHIVEVPGEPVIQIEAFVCDIDM